MKNAKILAPKPLPFDFENWKQKPFAERVKMLCIAWATQGYGAPFSTYVFYIVKIGFYVGMWMFFCTFSTDLGGVREVAEWWFQPEALLKFLVWSMLFEVVGLGCGSGPLTARYFPPLGGILHFARLETIKLALFPKIPIIGGDKRNILDVLLYVALLGSLIRVLIAPTYTIELLVPIVVLLPYTRHTRQNHLPSCSLRTLFNRYCLFFICRRRSNGRKNRLGRNLVGSS